MVHIVACAARRALTGAIALLNGKGWAQSRSISRKSKFSAVTETRCYITKSLTGTTKINR